jgi:hypothetical protein
MNRDTGKRIKIRERALGLDRLVLLNRRIARPYHAGERTASMMAVRSFGKSSALKSI